MSGLGLSNGIAHDLSLGSGTHIMSGRGLSSIIGNEPIKEKLRDSIRTGHIHQGYLITGEKGLGKKTLVKNFLLELFCQDPDKKTGEPCLKCPGCKKLLSGNHTDVSWLSHGSAKSIGVDKIRDEIKDTADIRPLSSRYKVYVIPDAHLLTPQAQNALLKILEEPPLYVIFILISDDDMKLLDTVRSRLTQIKMLPLKDSQILDYLENHLDARDEKADICVAFAKGNLGRAIILYQDETFSDWYQRLMKIIKNLRGMSPVDIRIEVNKLKDSCPDLDDVLDLMELWYRDLMLYMVTKDMNGLVFKGESRTLMSMASNGNTSGIQRIMERIETARGRLKANVNPALCMELLFLSIKDRL